MALLFSSIIGNLSDDPRRIEVENGAFYSLTLYQFIPKNDKVKIKLQLTIYENDGTKEKISKMRKGDPIAAMGCTQRKIYLAPDGKMISNTYNVNYITKMKKITYDGSAGAPAEAVEAEAKDDEEFLF